MNNFSGPGRAIGRVCVCVRTINVELNDLWPRYLAAGFTSTLPTLSSKVKVTDQSWRSEDDGNVHSDAQYAVNVFYGRTLYLVTHCWLFVESMSMSIAIFSVA